MYVRYPQSLRNIENLLHERGIDITHETVRFLGDRFGVIFAAEIRRSRVRAMRSCRHRRWHCDAVFREDGGGANAESVLADLSATFRRQALQPTAGRCVTAGHRHAMLRFRRTRYLQKFASL
jgi:hypothetical protein